MSYNSILSLPTSTHTSKRIFVWLPDEFSTPGLVCHFSPRWLKPPFWESIWKPSSDKLSTPKSQMTRRTLLTLDLWGHTNSMSEAPYWLSYDTQASPSNTSSPVLNTSTALHPTSPNDSRTFSNCPQHPAQWRYVTLPSYHRLLITLCFSNP